MSITNSDTLHRTGTSKVSITNLILNTFNAEVQHIINYNPLSQTIIIIDLLFVHIIYTRVWNMGPDVRVVGSVHFIGTNHHPVTSTLIQKRSAKTWKILYICTEYKYSEKFIVHCVIYNAQIYEKFSRLINNLK